MGHIDVDWDRSGRWAVIPPTLALIEGSGGNAVLLGARTGGTWQRLVELRRRGVVKDLMAVASSDAYPSTWFVGVASGDDLDSTAAELGGTAVTEPVWWALNHFADLRAIVESARARFVPSGFQAKTFDAPRLRFVDAEVTKDDWPPGCFEQRSQGKHRYIFVNDNGERHILDRWVAVHAELDRCRRRGVAVPDVLTWDRRSQRMANLAGAQLPVQWARAAILCTGLPPHRATQASWTDIYEGVKVTLWKGFCEALAIPLVGEDLSRFDEELR